MPNVKRMVLASDDQSAPRAIGPVYTDASIDKIRDEIAADRGGPRWLYPSLSGDTPVKFMNIWSRMTETGVNGTPSLATAAKGKEMLAATVNRLITIATEFRDMPVAPRVDHRQVPDSPA